MTQATEFLDALVTMELCAKLNDRPNSALKACCKSIHARLADAKVKAIINGVARQSFPVGAVAMLRRNLDDGWK
ncbi:hypothetical protein vBYenSP400_09 [Yersinia phage vB_YenS_P400]|nr:hypothetical protein vBYenSP400_09 [Yersinia phage vB_YenS_P400]